MELQKVFDHKFIKVFFDFEKKIMRIVRCNTLTNNDEYKESVYLIAGKIEKYKPKAILVDMREFSYPVNPELYSLATKIFTQQTIDLKIKIAVYLMPQDFVSNISIREMTERAKQLGVNIIYSTSEEEAFEKINEAL